MSHNHEIPAIFAELRDSNTATGRALRALAEPSPEQKHMKRHNCLTRMYLAFYPNKTLQEAEAYADATMERQAEGHLFG